MRWIVRVAVLVYLLFPIYWGINSSLKTETERITSTTYIVQNPTLAQYEAVIHDPILLRALLNSSLVAIISVAIALFLGTWAGYALARLDFPGRRIILYLILSMTVFPQISSLTGLFSIMRQLGLYGSLYALFLTYPILTLPMSVWFFSYFYRGIPMSLEEAARMDGATFLQFYSFVLLPLSRPALASVGILSFVLAWNEYLYALTFTIINPEAQTVTVAITQEGSIGAAILLSLPIVIAILFFQKSIVNILSGIDV